MKYCMNADISESSDCMWWFYWKPAALFNKVALSVFYRLWTGSKLGLLQWKQWLQHWLNLRLVDYDPGLIISIQYSTIVKSVFINTLQTIIFMSRLE